MPSPLQMPWSDNPNAPKIPYGLYLGEKAYFAGFLMGAIFYGIVVVLFFQCTGAFFDPANRAKGGIKWGLVAHTFAMFSLATIYTSMSSNIQSISFIDNRGFPASVNGVLGPVGYQFFIASKAIGATPTAIILLNGWLADGLLLYRCYIVYAKNFWAITFPSLLYLASVASGILFAYKVSRPEPVAKNAAAMVHFGAPYLSISFAVNILLTLMIVGRLVVHRKNIRNAMGAAGNKAGGLYTTIISITVESYSLTAVVAILFIGTWAVKSFVQYIFLQILAQVQVIAPFLILIRIANRKAVTTESFNTETVDSIRFRAREKPESGSESLPGRHTTDSMSSGEPDVGAGTMIDFHNDSASESKEPPQV